MGRIKLYSFKNLFTQIAARKKKCFSNGNKIKDNK